MAPRERYNFRISFAYQGVLLLVAGACSVGVVGVVALFVARLLVGSFSCLIGGMA